MLGLNTVRGDLATGENGLAALWGKIMPLIGHIQIASVPDRAEPDHGELDYSHVFQVLRELAYDKPLGAEYKPARSVEAGFGVDDI